MSVTTSEKRFTCSFSDYLAFLCIFYEFLFKLLSVNNGELKSCKVPTVTPIVYTPAELKSLRYNSSMSTLRLDGNVRHKIKLLGIKKRYRGHRSRRRKLKQKDWNTGVHLDLLRPLSRRLIDYSVDRNLSFSIVNTQSICNKVDEFLHHIIESKLDICCVTETWLDDSNPKHRIIRSDLNIPSYTFIDVPRKFRSGGGSGILFKNTLQIKLINSGQKDSFEYSLFELDFHSKTIHILIVYRPPYSRAHPVSTTAFFDEFTSFLEEIITTHRTVIICGDFNIHYNKVNDLDTIALNEMCDVMGLCQLVNCQTHRSGNTIDLIMIRNNDKIVLSEPSEDFQISDHSFIHTYISLPKPKIIRETRKVRKISAINSTQFINDLVQFNKNATKHEKLDDLAKFYNILDKHAPEKEKLVTIRPTLPWFTEESCRLKTRCRSAERRWRGNKTADNDHAFRCAKRAYRKHLRYNKYKHINSNITECGKDASKMYKLVFGLISRTNSNPMPPCTSDESLADEFSSFFMDKILTIRKTLDNFEKFDPNLGSKCTIDFKHFDSVSDEDVLGVTKTQSPLPAQLTQSHQN